MKQTNLLFVGFLTLFCLLQAQGQQFRIGGMFKTSSQVDSLNYDLDPKKVAAPQGFLTKFRSKTGKLSLSMELNILHLSHLKPIKTEPFPTERPILTQKRTQFQVKLGLHILLKNANSPAKP